MPGTIAPLATFLAGSILTFAIPIASVIAVTCWYVFLWRRGMGER